MNDRQSRNSKNDDSENIDHAKKEMLKSIATLLQEIVDEQGEKKENKKSIFTSRNVPGISIEKYLERLIRYTKLETATLISVLIYIDRICEMNKLQITKYSVHRLLLSAVVMSIKINEDDFYSNAYYSKVGGITLSEINTLEDEFLTLIDFKLWIDIKLFNKYKMYLSKYDKE